MGVLLPVLLQLLSGGSVDGAAYLAEGKADIAFNWSGKQTSLRPASSQSYSSAAQQVSL